MLTSSRRLGKVGNRPDHKAVNESFGGKDAGSRSQSREREICDTDLDEKLEEVEQDHMLAECIIF
jgi:hypothetical protein